MELSDAPSRVVGVISRSVEGETLLVHPARRKVQVVNSVGARLWELADGKRTLGQMASVIAEEYAVESAQAQADAIAFCSDLAQRGLLTVAA